MAPIMSFRPEIYDKIIDQIKLIEYRRCFPKNCNMAYMYVSRSIKAICGIIYFGNLHSLYDWQNEFREFSEVQHRINDYLENENYRYGAEISAIQKIKPITLDELRKNVPNFAAPQSYMFVDNNQSLKQYIEKNIKHIGPLIKNDLTEIYPQHICQRYQLY